MGTHTSTPSTASTIFLKPLKSTIRWWSTRMPVIRSTVLIGKDGKVKKHWARVASAEKHPEQVLNVVRELD